ncbi:MAG: ABC transporter substrate-binding protein [Puniceicoccales bacterium]|jgi:sulfonate transport system substrate-binding protein|nr:ABC transporter substrate-binding protein [Puniceicoccales bacterium]
MKVFSRTKRTPAGTAGTAGGGRHHRWQRTTRHLAPAKIAPSLLIGTACIFAAIIALFFLSPERDNTFSPATPATTSATTSAGNAPTGSASAPRPTGVVREVRAGLNAWAVLAEQKGWFAEEFDKLGARVTLVDRRVVGNAEAALFERGDLHIAERMAYPSLQHKANGFDFVIVWASGDCHPRRATTVVRADSPYKTLADLRGKRIGGHRLGCPYFATFEALRAAGLEWDTKLKKGDVRFVNITGAPAINALLAGEIDAYAAHPALPDVSALYKRGLVRDIETALPAGQYTGGGGRALVITTRRYADANPDLVRAYLRVYDRARRYIVEGERYEEAADALAKAYRIPREIALFGIRDESSLSLNTGRANADEAVAGLHKFLAWAVAKGDDLFGTKPLTREQVNEFVDRRFFEGGEFYVATGGKQHCSESSPADYKFQPTVVK